MTQLQVWCAFCWGTVMGSSLALIEPIPSSFPWVWGGYGIVASVLLLLRTKRVEGKDHG